MNNQPPPQRSPTLALLPTLLAISILLVAAYLRLSGLATTPPGLSRDEALNGLDALRFLRSGVIPFYLQDGRPEPLFRFIQATTILVAGSTPFGLKLASVFTGILTVAAAYRAGRHFSPRGHNSRRWAGLIAAGLMAVMIGHVHLSRVAYRAILQPFAMLMFFDAFVSYWETQSRRNAVFSGLWLGVAMLSYTAAYAILPLVALIFIQQFIVFLAGLPDSFDKGFDLKGMLTFVGIFLLAVAPLIYLIAIQPNFFFRVSDVSNDSGMVSRLINNPGKLVSTWEMIYKTSDINPQYNIDQNPMLPSMVYYVLMLLGLLVCLLRPHRVSTLLAAGFLGFSLLPVALSSEVPHGLRIVGVYAALPLLVTAITDPILWASRRLKRGYLLRAGYALSIGGLLVFSGLQTDSAYRAYFADDVRWGPGEGTISAFSWFFQTRHQTMADLIADSDQPIYLPLEDSALPSMRHFTMQSHPNVVSYTELLGEGGSLELPPGQIIISYRNPDAATYSLYLPDGRLVLLPRFDDALLAQIHIKANTSEILLVDDYGEIAGTLLSWDEPITLSASVPNPISVNYKDQFTLVGWDAPFLLTPGEQIEVTLYFQAGEAKRRDPTFYVQLWTVGGERLSSSEEPLLHRWLYPVNEWKQGEIIPVVAHLTIPDGLSAGAYHIAVGLNDWLNEPISVLGVDGSPVAEAAVAGVVKQARESAISAEGIISVEAQFGEEISLLGYTLTDAATGETITEFEPGQSVIVSLYWRADRRPSDDYTVFVHIVGARGEIVAQNDSQPEGGQYPTGIWEPGEVVVTSHFIVMGDELDSPFSLFAGLYSWPSLQRLPAMQEGQLTEDGRGYIDQIP